MKLFLDTNALLKTFNTITEPIIISSVTLEELENIKVSSHKDGEIKYMARHCLHWLDENPDKYEVVVYDNKMQTFDLEPTPDVKICACAYAELPYDSVFVTDDMCCKMIAKHIFKLPVTSTNGTNDDDYKGYKEITLTQDEMAYLYEHMNENKYELLENEYLIISNTDNEIVDKLRWTKDGFQIVKFPTIKSNYFGTVKPYNGDIYQQLALNSLSVNQVTMIKGSAGTGKSYLAIGYLLWALEKHKIDKIVIFCNTVATINSAKLGFYPGTKDEKLLDSQIGNMLSSKLGGMFGVEQMIQENKLLLLPMSDIRGFDTTGMNCGVYITEAQNLDISLMKLALQRIGSDSICIIDGDYFAQVDMSQYAGTNNGMRRMSEVFRGQDFYGEIELKNIYRSRIAEIADKM